MKEWLTELPTQWEFTVPVLNNSVDYFLIALLFWGAIRGFRAGFLAAITSLLALVGAWIIAGRLSSHLLDWVKLTWPELMLPPLLDNILAFLVIFLTAHIVIKVVAGLLQSAIISGPLVPMNRLLGAIFGLVSQGAFLTLLLGIFSPFIMAANIPWFTEAVHQSTIAVSLMNWFGYLMPWLLESIN